MGSAGWRTSMMTGVLVMWGCGSDTVRPSPEAPLRPASESLLDAAPALAVALDDGRILAETTEGLILIRNPGDEGTLVGAVGEIGELRTAATVDGATLIVGSEGVFVLRDEAFFVSPLADALGEESVLGIVGTPRLDSSVSDLWVLTDGALYLYRDDTLAPIQVEGIVFTGATIASAPLLRGRSVWVSTQNEVLELWMRDGTLQAALVSTKIVPTSMTADGSGSLWLLEEGDILSLNADRRLTRYALPFDVTRIDASTAGPDLWIRGAGGELWHHAGGSFRSVDVSMEAIDAGPDGVLLVAAEGLSRLRARHPVRLLGPDSGARVIALTEIEIQPEAAEAVTRISARLNDSILDVLSEPTRVQIDPETLSGGTQRLDLTIEYSDGTLPVELRRVYQVGLEANWAEDVEPIYQAWCGECHGDAGPAPTRLDSRDRFEDEIDRILFNVREGRMPLGRDPMDPDTIAVIEAWAASGFPE